MPTGHRIKAMQRLGVEKPSVVAEEAHRADLRLDYALAMLHMETGPRGATPGDRGFKLAQRNVFGCDHGPAGGRVPFCGETVTEARVKALLDSGQANGVGWCQLTYRPFVIKAQQLGGAHKPRYQMRVGFDVLAGLIRANGVEVGFARYNGSGSAAAAYGREAKRLAEAYHRQLQ